MGSELLTGESDRRVRLIGRPAAVKLRPVRQRRRQSVRMLQGPEDFVSQGYPLLVGELVKIWNFYCSHVWDDS